MKRGRALLADALEQGIEACPTAPSSMQRLFAQLDTVPSWVDWAAIERAGAVLLRTGLAGGTVLGAKSLLTGLLLARGKQAPYLQRPAREP